MEPRNPKRVFLDLYRGRSDRSPLLLKRIDLINLAIFVGTSFGGLSGPFTLNR
jgi:hypothetical protein